MFSITEKVTPSRTGENGKLKLFSAFQIIQDCSEMWMNSESTLKNYFQENHRAQILASRQLEVIRVPQRNENLTITTSVFECMPLFGFRNTIVYDEQGLPCYETWSTGAFVNSLTGCLSKLPEEILQSITYDPKYPMNYMDRKITLPEGLWESQTPIEVKRNDIDYNHHMNNAHYIRVAMEFLPENFETKRVRIEYKKPAQLGNLLYPKILQKDHLLFITLNSEDSLYAALEFSEK